MDDSSSYPASIRALPVFGDEVARLVAAIDGLASAPVEVGADHTGRWPEEFNARGDVASGGVVRLAHPVAQRFLESISSVSRDLLCAWTAEFKDRARAGPCGLALPVGLVVFEGCHGDRLREWSDSFALHDEVVVVCRDRPTFATWHPIGAVPPLASCAWDDLAAGVMLVHKIASPCIVATMDEARGITLPPDIKLHACKDELAVIKFSDRDPARAIRIMYTHVYAEDECRLCSEAAAARK